MKIQLHLIISALLLTFTAHAQNIQVFGEDFNTNQNPFIMNSGSVGANTGPNQWVLNASYNGSGGCPTTLSQNNTVTGTIAGAPNSTYMHIYDGTGSSTNACYNPSSASDRFVELGTGVCTKALYDVKVTFFYLVEGDAANAYGEFYFSADGKPWQKAGQAKYVNQGVWRYEVIQDPAMDNVQELRIGFRWINNGSGGSKSTAFSIDDPIIVGSYDAINHPVNMNITTVTPNPVCRGSNLIVFYNFSDTLCQGTYQFQLSNGKGSFNNPTSLGVITYTQPVTGGAVSVGIPGTLTADTCYKIRINRLSPPPYIQGVASICFEVKDCPVTITTLQPVVTMIPPGDSVCINSVIDVPFTSVGTINTNNSYIAELSDSSGSFNNPYFLGSIPDPDDHPFPPGNVSGLIPTVPEGCNYYVRVRSTSPVAIGSLWGPFCIKECDISTNNYQDIQLCINESEGDSVVIPVDINSWNQYAQYFLGNQFCVELRSMMNFGLVNKCDLGAKFDTASTTMTVYAPPLAQLLGLGIAPGAYYMRIVADSANNTVDLLGTVVRLTIGAPSENQIIISTQDTSYCQGEVVRFDISPVNINSTYEWKSPQINGGTPFEYGYPPPYLLVNMNTFSGTFELQVRELNYGCYGPWSGTFQIPILPIPNANIIGPTTVCLGDTVEYKVTFSAETYFGWNIDGGGTIIDTSNNIATVAFDSVGEFFNLTITAINKCGVDQGFKVITVYDLPEVEAVGDIIACEGDQILLAATHNGNSARWFDEDGNTVSNDDSTYIDAFSSQEYTVRVTGLGGCRSWDTVMVNVKIPPEIITDSMSICPNEIAALDAGTPAGALSYLWSTGETSQVITVGETGVYTVSIAIADSICEQGMEFTVEEDVCDAAVFIPNAFSPNGDGNNDIFFLINQDAVLDYLRIYNRWGQLIFETTDMNAGWDGTYKGEPMPVGVYTWTVQYQDPIDGTINESGHLHLLR